MARLSVYIPDDLKARMDETDANWSSIAQTAFELEIRSHPRGDADVTTAAIERLRASKAKIEQQARPEWINAGREWALNIAEFDELERIASLNAEDKGLDLMELLLERGQQAWSFLSAVVEAVHGNKVGADEIEAFAQDVIGKARPSKQELSWWLTGAAEVWDEVKDKL
jgi:predicted hydrocarbon binding protein